MSGELLGPLPVPGGPLGQRACAVLLAEDKWESAPPKHAGRGGGRQAWTGCCPGTQAWLS